MQGLIMKTRYFHKIRFFLFGSVIIGLTVLLIPSCKSSWYLPGFDMSSAYSEDSGAFKPQVRIYNVNGDTSIVYVKLDPLKISRDPGQSETRKDFFIHYRVFDYANPKVLIDSATILFSPAPQLEKNTDLFTEFRIKNGSAGTGFVVITFMSYDKKKSSTRLVNFDRSTPDSPDYYFVSDEQGLPLFSRYIVKGQKFNLSYFKKETHKLYVRYYKRDFPIAKPPFITEKDLYFSFKPDSMFTIGLNGGISDQLNLDKKGIYHFQTDTSRKQGFTIYRFDDNFPFVASAEEALEPLRYLTTHKEFITLDKYDNKKTAVDSFWLELAGNNEDQARKMIQKFYGRVQTANYLFTSYQEGWKTDRGIVYIIFGPPSFTNFDGKHEEWIYGERGNPYSIEFNFVNVSNYLSPDDFSLIKSPVYKQAWYIALENWRK